MYARALWLFISLISVVCADFGIRVRKFMCYSRAESDSWFMGMSSYIVGLNLEFKQLYKAMCTCFRSQGLKLRGIIMIMILGKLRVM